MTVDAKTAYARRVAGKCVTCGLRAPKPDTEAGFPAMQCQECENREARLKREALKSQA